MQTQAAPTEPSFTFDGAELFVVPSDQVGDAWPEIKRHIERIEDAPWSPADVLRELLSGKALAWGMRADHVLGFWITRIENTWTRRFAVVWIVAGTGIEFGLPAYREVIEPWLFNQGAEWIEVHGRKGWKRVLPDYQESAVVLRKYRG